MCRDYLSSLIGRQLEEVEDAELLVSRILFSPRTRPVWQDRRYMLYRGENVNKKPLLFANRLAEMSANRVFFAFLKTSQLN